MLYPSVCDDVVLRNRLTNAFSIAFALSIVVDVSLLDASFVCKLTLGRNISELFSLIL